MANTPLNPGSGGKTVASLTVGGVEYQQVRAAHQDKTSNIWTASNIATTGNAATITQAAAAAGTKNVCTSLTVKLSAGGTAPTATNTSVSLIDGATGGTTYLWRATISIPATAGADNGITISNLWLPGSAATGMTLEFLGGITNCLQSVTMSGTTVAVES